MPTTSFFFNQTSFASEQKLFDSLAIEMIKIHGVDLIYMPRTTPNVDKLFLEDPTSEFNNAIHIEMYIKNFQGWQGDGDLMSKFGISMADQITFACSRTRFQEEIGSVYDIIRPREGDLIYFSIPNTIFEVKFVEHESTFYQSGGLTYFDIKCERFNYSAESLNTGIEDIDKIEKKYTTAILPDRLDTESQTNIITEDGIYIDAESGNIKITDPLAQNDFLGTQDSIINFNVSNPFGDT